MPVPVPRDSLDEPIAEFVQAVDDFLSMNLAFDELPPIEPAGPNPSWADIQRVWEDSKRAIRKAHASILGVQPEVAERLEVVTVKGTLVLELTDDPYIVGPVSELVELMAEVRAVVTKLESLFGKAASVLGFVVLILEVVGLKDRLVPLSARIATARDNLIAYNLLRQPPPGSA
ncbi:hypothetical protein AU196_02835 [Mycobacterium sp. IS-1742]|nr:hypothetical protein AU196_02835 [Mycobacterium sp. IS-1742]